MLYPAELRTFELPSIPRLHVHANLSIRTQKDNRSNDNDNVRLRNAEDKDHAKDKRKDSQDTKGGYVAFTPAPLPLLDPDKPPLHVDGCGSLWSTRNRSSLRVDSGGSDSPLYQRLMLRALTPTRSATCC